MNDAAGVPIDYTFFRSGLLEPAPASPALYERFARDGDVAEIWRELSVPDDPRRWFLHAALCGTCKGTGSEWRSYPDSDGRYDTNKWICGSCRGTGDSTASTIESNPTEKHLFALGDRVQAMLEAEQAAWGAVEALRPWGLTAADRLVWRVGSPAHHEDGAHTVGFPYAVQAPMNAIWKYHADRLTETESRARVARGGPLITDLPYFNVWHEIREHLRWELAARSGLRVPEIEDIRSDHRRRVTEDRLRLMEQARSYSDGEDPDRQWFLEDPLPVPLGSYATDGADLAGMSFADLPNPYTPLLRVWLTGFAFDRIEDGAVVLHAPPRGHGNDRRREPSLDTATIREAIPGASSSPPTQPHPLVRWWRRGPGRLFRDR
ncbi:hypothetical protein [Nocardia aurea]|uniref:hypothetical protein n=1 Tax=Nocardia aurea TaxID=2144174 RepID=UPI000D69AE9D|nr:hypothetical protein [Nocardia aurea]